MGPGGLTIAFPQRGARAAKVGRVVEACHHHVTQHSRWHKVGVVDNRVRCVEKHGSFSTDRSIGVRARCAIRRRPRNRAIPKTWVQLDTVEAIRQRVRP